MSGAAERQAQVSEEVRGLAALNIDALRVEWRRRFDAPPPAVRAADLLRRCLAERIQTEAFGQDVELQRRLSALVRAHNRGAKPRAPKPVFTPGTILAREHAGRTHRVEVLTTGFLWEGKTYGSLSQIARAITGVHWNGPRFFGLREGKAAGASR